MNADQPDHLQALFSPGGLLHGHHGPGPSLEDDDSPILEMLGYREASEMAADLTGGPEAPALTFDWTEVISTRAHDFVLRWETGGKAYYQQIIKERPIWPGYASGVTIGCGYDLGYHSRSEFDADWGDLLPQAVKTRLVNVLGFRTTDPNRSVKVARAQQLVIALKDIRIPWDIAIRQFDTSKLPRLVRDLYGALDNLDRLHPHCRGALLSLVFNRGKGGFRLPGDRYTELRDIKSLMHIGTDEAFAAIPAQLRAMARIWGRQSSLSVRRDEEARLFEDGLAEMALMANIRAIDSSGAPESPLNALVEDHADQDGTWLSDTDDMPEDGDGGRAVLEAAPVDVRKVRWNPNDDDQPDYRHLPKRNDNHAFELIAEDIVKLLDLNDFRALPGLVVFGLRGAAIVGSDRRVGVDRLTLVDQRPDHRDFRCVMGVFNPASGQISAFRASTVPEASAVARCLMKAQSRSPLEGNILPTGLYTYTVGTHRAGTPSEIRGVLRLSNSATGASKVVVLRSVDDLMYDRRDLWDPCTPADNIHPGRRSNGFSSLGCLTLPGDYHAASRKGTGLWQEFRTALGLGLAAQPAEDGRQFSTMLLTGLDAALVARLRSGDHQGPELSDSLLRRLRFGSQGPRVAALQAQLNLAPDATQKAGPVTISALTKLQKHRLGWADGILSRDMQADLGLAVF